MIDFKNSRVVLFLLGTGFIIFTILIFGCGPEMIVYSHPFKWNDVISSDKASIFSNVLTPMVAWAAAALTFLAFFIQYKANIEQNIQFKKQADDVTIQRFENRFFELIQFHQNNSSSIELTNSIGEIKKNKLVFTLMYDELYFIFRICQGYDNLLKGTKDYPKYTEQDILKLAYILFYTGVGHRSDIVSKYLKGKFDVRLYTMVTKRLKVLQGGKFESFFDSNGNYFSSNNLHVDKFKGHLDYLGMYYRHLYQTVKFVCDQKHPLFKYQLKREYLKILRAQLSDFEQLLLYYNGLSGFGEKWISNKYFTDYRMIHNIPLPLAHFGRSPEEMFKDEIDKQLTDDPIFEW